MDIIKRKDSLSKEPNVGGEYYYDNIGTPIEIYGNISEDGNFELTERDTKGDVTGTFKGIFTHANTMKGVWINPKTKKETPFDLTEVTEGIALFDFKEYDHDNCDSRKKNIKSTKKDTLNYTDTLCSYIDISLINVKNLKPNAVKKINTILLNSLLQTGLGEKYKTVNDLLHSIDTKKDFDYVDAQYGMGIVSNETNVLSIGVSYWANTGGAHPNGCMFYLNFNTQTGDTIVLKDILLPEAKLNLTLLAQKKFVEANGAIKENGWFYDEGIFKLTDNFAITKGGLLFEYQEYEAGPYAMGMPQFFIPNKELAGIIKPEYLK
jgi:hypothetical protein